MKRNLKATLLLFLAALLIGSSSSLLANSKEAMADYRKGFQEGTHALKNQFEAQGWRQKEVIFKNYIIALPTKKLAINDIAYICDVSRHYGFNPIVTQNVIVFGDYDREADAESNAKYINEKLGIKSYAQNVKKKHYYTYPLFQNIYKEMERDIKEKNDVLVVTEYTNKIKTVVKKCNSKPKGKRVTYFRINKPVVQGYSYDEVSKHPKVWKDEHFKPSRVFKDNDQLYKKGKTIKTIDGEFYIKVYNKNLFFRSANVKIMNIYI